MAAVSQPISPVSRQPFAALGDARLRAVESMKNKQNGVPPKSLKRRYDASDLSDTENVDPISTGSTTKRQKSHVQQDFCKPTESLNLVNKFQNIETPVKKAIETSRFTAPKSISTPKSAPLRASAGRSPKSKVAKAFSRRSIGPHARNRPQTSSKQHTPRAPFSIAQALNGTFNTPKASKSAKAAVSDVSYKKSWNFEIYVDTEQDEMANLIEHSTCTLDISDDEGRGGPKDDRGKENIPPPELSNRVHTVVNAPYVVSPENIDMEEEPRAPLGELDTKNFVPEGVNASDSILVPEDDQEPDPAPKKRCSPLSATETAAADEPSSLPEQAQLFSNAAINHLISDSAPSVKDDAICAADNPTNSSAAEFDIWESGSATEESAVVESQCLTS